MKEGNYYIHSEYESSSNCIGYVFYTLGLSSVDMYISPSDNTLFDYFELAPDAMDAHAIAVIFQETLLHMAIIDQSDPTQVIDRQGNETIDRDGGGKKVSKRPLSDLLQQYTSPQIKHTYLRIK